MIGSRCLIILHSQIQYNTTLNTNIRDERVCNTETSGTPLTPEHSSPHCVAEWGVSGFNGQANGFEI